MRAALTLTSDHRSQLDQIAGSRMAPYREVERAKILLAYAQGKSISAIGRDLWISRPTICKCIDKALQSGVMMGLKDYYHRPHEPEITREAKTWVVNLACKKPKDLGLAAEVWTLSALGQYVAHHAEQAGYSRLKAANKNMVWRILNQYELKPHRIRYYLEQRDKQYDQKMNQVLKVYRDANLYRNDESQIHDGRPRQIISVSVDEKPGIQALEQSAPDLAPVPGKYSCIARDHEYVRHGTLSILASLDLHTGEIIANVEERHRSREFIGLLQRLDDHYPPEALIRIVLDNHSAHTSKETMSWLRTRPDRFEYVLTPKHGSWLNLIESAFSKMARSFLRHIRVKSLNELKERIHKGIREWNEKPVRFQWKNFDFQVPR